MHAGGLSIIGVTLPGRQTIRTALLSVSALLLLFALLKRSSDRDELSFVEDQLRSASQGAPEAPSSALLTKRDADHREALLSITGKERALRAAGDEGHTSWLSQSIEQDVSALSSRVQQQYEAGDSAWLQFEKTREQQVRHALVLDRVLLVIAVLGLASGAAMYGRELRNGRRNRPL